MRVPSRLHGGSDDVAHGLDHFAGQGLVVLHRPRFTPFRGIENRRGPLFIAVLAVLGGQSTWAPSPSDPVVIGDPGWVTVRRLWAIEALIEGAWRRDQVLSRTEGKTGEENRKRIRGMVTLMDRQDPNLLWRGHRGRDRRRRDRDRHGPHHQRLSWPFPPAPGRGAVLVGISVGRGRFLPGHFARRRNGNVVLERHVLDDLLGWIHARTTNGAPGRHTSVVTANLAPENPPAPHLPAALFGVRDGPYRTRLDRVGPTRTMAHAAPGPRPPACGEGR